MLLKIILVIGSLLIAEIVILALIIRFCGVVVGAAIIIGTALLGAVILAPMRVSAVLRLKGILTRSTPLEEGVLHTLLLYLSGVLLISPGIIGDLLGLLLLLPCFRTKITRKARKIAEEFIERRRHKVNRIGCDNTWQK